MIHLLSRIKYGSLLVLDDAVRWRWSLLSPWLIYAAVGLLLYVVGDGAAAGLLALCTAVTFITIVVSNGHRISDSNRSVSGYSVDHSTFCCTPVFNDCVLTFVIASSLSVTLTRCRCRRTRLMPVTRLLSGAVK